MQSRYKERRAGWDHRQEPRVTVVPGMIRKWAGISMALALLVACGDSGNGGNRPPCPEGHLAEGLACTPIFADPGDCAGPGEMPALGGGCRPVGVLQCAEGFLPDGEGGCDAILPPGPDPCPPGTVERIGSDQCQPVGVLQCAFGFVSDGEGGCDAILPPGPDPCPPGTIEEIGHDVCQPLGDCGPDPMEGGSPWGLVPVDGATVHVDATADATGASGTVAAPYPTIGEALEAAAPGAQVVIAAGEYVEALVVSKPLRLVGRCAALVTIRGRVQLGQARPAVRITSGGTGSEVRGLTLTGPGEGLVVSGAREVEVVQVEVLGAGSYGVSLQGESEVTLRWVKVAESTIAGIASQDSEFHLVKSVVRGILPEPGTQRFGMGVLSFCSSANAPGSLLVEASLVASNHQAGIFAAGVNATVLSSVVKDTQAQQSDQRWGRGIAAQCEEPANVCGSLRVEGSLVTGNRDVGIIGSGAGVTVLSSVVRDTKAELRGKIAGWGIVAQCHEGMGVCGSLEVDGCLVAGNGDVGILSSVDATVRASVVRDTQAEEHSQTGGIGISAGYDDQVGFQVSLHLEGSLVEGNRHVGVFAAGAETTVLSSVVRDTKSQEIDQELGMGIVSQCSQRAEVCGLLHVEGSLVAGNRYLGILAAGADATVRRTVVRDTRPMESDLTYGAGIGARCDLSWGVCGSLHVEGSLVTGNHFQGIVAAGVDTSVVLSVVRDTLPQQSDQAFGRGIEAQCNPGTGACGSLLVEGSLVAGNRNVGIFSAVDTTVVSSVVRDTLPQKSDQRGGRGINVQCDPRLGFCGRFAITDSLVVRSQNTGIFIAGVRAELQGVAVVSTEANQAGPFEGLYGQGIWAICHPEMGACGALSITGCLVASSHGVGVALEGVSGFMASSAVSAVLPQPLDGKYGYGVQIGGKAGEASPTFHVRECAIRDAKLAGVLYVQSGGLLSGSVVSGGEYSVAMNEGSSPTIGMDNQLSGIVKDSPQWVSLTPSPAPPPATPSRAPAE